ncbi:hypothetical protein BRADI_1g43937v3 [Brachypodium distachyon]|uniref:Uncharacterized protein n=1 Tax=Brachypodium distachyon TaxID=15368 RepID=A0A2K2DP88_BRADI|nr:hypothetical protein BRADI_1g43937v3 [Brachypodium distachyon]
MWLRRPGRLGTSPPWKTCTRHRRQLGVLRTLNLRNSIDRMDFTIDHSPAIKLRQTLWRRWHHHVTMPRSARPDFFMVASFGRCKFRLDEIPVANLLNVGGAPEEFRVGHIRDRTFRFSVTNHFTFTTVVVYFHLWGFWWP